MYVVTSTWKMDPARRAVQQKELHERIVPMVRQQPGFVHATWSYDAASHRSVSHLVFDSETAARKLAAYLQASAATANDAGVSFESLVVTEVLADARRPS